MVRHPEIILNKNEKFLYNNKDVFFQNVDSMHKMQSLIYYYLLVHSPKIEK